MFTLFPGLEGRLSSYLRISSEFRKLSIASNRMLSLRQGIAHGGSLIFYASLCKAMGRGRVIGVDIEIRPHNRIAIEAHELASYITLMEGGSTTPEIVDPLKVGSSPASLFL